FGHIAHARGGAAHRSKRFNAVGRTVGSRSIAGLGLIARLAGTRDPARHTGVECVRWTRTAGTGAGFGHVADTGCRATRLPGEAEVTRRVAAGGRLSILAAQVALLTETAVDDAVAAG